tara:strand:- start:742 stop:846 length:105 start_codon:yes stop_codon:yes gene_type:complete
MQDLFEGYDLLNDANKQKVYNRLSVVMNEIFGEE